jgi:hypothetical protein
VHVRGLERHPHSRTCRRGHLHLEETRQYLTSRIPSHDGMSRGIFGCECESTVGKEIEMVIERVDLSRQNAKTDQRADVLQG